MRAYLYHRDGTLIEELPLADGASIRAADDQGIRRVASFQTPLHFLADLKVSGRRVVITSGTGTRRFSGYIDEVQPSIEAETWVSVQCRDKGKVYKLARFAADVTYEDAATTSTTLSHTPTATSELAAGDQIQGQGQIYNRTLEVTALGITSQVAPTAESGDLRTGTYSIDYQAGGLSGLLLTFYEDLLAQETLQAVTLTTNGIVVSTQISADGLAWTAFTAGATGRYLKAVITKAAGPITTGIVVTTATAAPASNVSTDDAASWRPRPTDLDRRLTLSLAAPATVNVLYLRCGVSDLDRETAYRADVETLAGGVWTMQLTDRLLVAGLNELVLPAVSADAVRITFKRGNAPVAVRYAKLMIVTSTVTIDQVVQTILGTEGEADFSLIQATRQTMSGNALTLEAGQEKLSAMTDLAESIGWEFFYDEQDRPVLRPRNWADPAGALEAFDAVLGWQPSYTDAEIYNQVLCLYEAGDNRLWSTATNDSGASSTSTVNIGTRTSPVLRNPLAATQAKLDAWAQEQLARYGRQASAASLATPWEPDAVPPEPGALVHITQGLTGTDGIFRVKATELVESADSLDLRLEVVDL